MQSVKQTKADECQEDPNCSTVQHRPRSSDRHGTELIPVNSAHFCSRWANDTWWVCKKDHFGLIQLEPSFAAANVFFASQALCLQVPKSRDTRDGTAVFDAAECSSDCVSVSIPPKRKVKPNGSGEDISEEFVQGRMTEPSDTDFSDSGCGKNGVALPQPVPTFDAWL